MRFLFDQNSDFRFIDHLIHQGHDVTRIGVEHPQGLLDEQVLAIAYRERCILVADDKDFGELVFRFGHRHAGIIYFRLEEMPLEQKIERLRYVLTVHNDDLGEYLTVDPRRVRVRRTL